MTRNRSIDNLACLYVEGLLEGEELRDFEERLNDDAEARQLVDEQRQLTELLHDEPLPDINYDLLASTISNAVAERQQLEMDVVCYANGELSDEAAAAVEQAIEDDVELQELLLEESQLTEFLATADPVPEVDYDQLHRKISTRIALEGESPSQREASIRQFWRPQLMAIAAMVVIAVLLGILLVQGVGLQNGDPGGSVAQDPNKNDDPLPAVADVSGPTVEESQAEAVATVSIGRPEGLITATTTLDLNNVNKEAVVIDTFDEALTEDLGADSPF